MAEIKNSYGDSHIRKSFNYKKQDDYMRTITVRMESETELSAEEIGKLQKVFGGGVLILLHTKLLEIANMI